MSETITTELPPPPRPLSRRARRRSWGELPVRIWVVLTAVVVVVLVYLAAQRIGVAMEERGLMERGRRVQAKVEDLVGVRAASVSRDAPVTVILSYAGANGQPQLLRGELPVADGSISRGDVIPIRVDPDIPDRWTGRESERPWTQELFVALLLVPPALLLAGITWWRRRRVLAVWRGGAPLRATVVDVKQSALAPASKRIGYRVAGGKRVHAVLRPNRLGPVSPGDELDLIADPSNPGRAVIASLYA